MFDWIADPNAWVALATLTALEIVLGVDNIIFISILVGRLPPEKRDLARRLGLSLAMGSRILLLLSLAWIMRLTEPLFAVFGQDVIRESPPRVLGRRALAGSRATAEYQLDRLVGGKDFRERAHEDVSGRDLILIGGGLFLLWKSVHEIHNSLEGESDTAEGGSAAAAARVSFAGVLVQIAIIDIVFSLDSVITAVGLADDVMVMVIAIVAAVAVMMFAAKPIAEGFGTHVPKGYIYFAMAFSFAVEMINIRLRKRMQPPVVLRKDMPGD